MKKTIFFLFTVVCTLAFAGCDDDDTTVESSLEIVSSDIGFEAAGGSGSILLMTSEASIKAVSNKSWLTIDSATPTTVSYTVAENTDALQRSAKITIAAGTASSEVTILQNGCRFELSSDPVTMDPAGETPSYIAFDTTLGSDPQISIPQDAAEWLSASVEEQQIKLTASLNYTKSRSTVITITQGWKPVEITVTQEVVDLLDTQALNLDREAQASTVSATKYMALFGDSWTVSSEDSWITLTEVVDGSFDVTVSENTTGKLRTGTVQVKSDAGEILSTVEVTQKIYSFEFFLGTWTMNYGSNQSVQVTLSEDPQDASVYLMTGLKYPIYLEYEDLGETAALSITCPQFIGIVSYTTSSNKGTAYLYLCPTTTSATSFNTATGIGYDCIYNLNETSQTLIPQPNAATSITINGLIFAGQDTSSGSWINFGNYHPLTSFTR